MSIDLEALLRTTSRTFALSIPVLPEPTRREVTIAYLLFRIADTFEDASHWSREARMTALAEFERLLLEPEAAGVGAVSASSARAEALAAAWTARGVATHEGYARLVAESPRVLLEHAALAPAARRLVAEHVARSARGMAGFVARTGEDGRLALGDLEDLRAYCYVVAGLVGEMLTELFLLGRETLAPAAEALRERAARFGEALQLVNILKDSEADLLEGRRYLPEGVPRAEVFALARRDLGTAGEYIEALRAGGAPRGILEFTALPVALAWSALERVESAGPGAKVSRPEVFLVAQRVRRSLDRGEAPVRLPGSTTR